MLKLPYKNNKKEIAMSLNLKFKQCLFDVLSTGYTCSPRGLLIKEKLNYSISLDDPRDRVITWQERNTNYKYLLAEFIWYVSGSNSVIPIQEYAPFWSSIQNANGTVNSAYGHRIFGYSDLYPYSQWDKVKELLVKDPDSRQAIIRINDAEDYTYDNKDVPCTLSLQFFIRENKLCMIVNMRSNDAILGLTNDVFQFTMLQEMMQLQLKADHFPDLELGTYYHNAGSMHLYDRHFDMAKGIISNTDIPKPFHMGVMELGDHDIENLIAVEKIWREQYKKDPTFNFETLNEFNSLSTYWKQLVNRCFRGL